MAMSAERVWAQDVPEPIRQAFQGRLFLNMGETAKLLAVNIKTLGKLIDAGSISYRQVGLGGLRPRRVFTAEDVVEFLAKQKRTGQPCRSLNQLAARSTASISSAAVVAFR